MSLDPEIADLLPTLTATFPRVETMTGVQARAAIHARLQHAAEPEPVGDIEEWTLPGPAGAMPARIYWPATASDSSLPIAVFAHGGGFVFCDLDSHDEFCRAMTNGLGTIVVSVDYRLAPEARWPAAAEDVYAATHWAAGHAAALGGDAARLMVIGDSAGGNLAAVTTLLCRDRHEPEIACQAMLYPVIAADFSTESYQQFGAGFYNTAAAMAWYWDQYVPTISDRAHPYASPLRAGLAGLPPAVVVTAGCDPLRSEGDAYVVALCTAGVPTVHRCYEGAIHGFMTMSTLRLAQHARHRLWTDISHLLSASTRTRPS